MKRDYSLLWLIVILPVFLAQCAKTEVSPAEETPEGPQDEKKTVTIRLTSQGISSRTSADVTTGAIFWEDEDQVEINGNVYTVQPDPVMPTSATVPDVPAAESYLAVYPAYTAYHGDSWLGLVVQPYQSQGSFIPMTAYSESTELTFLHIAGAINFGVTGSSALKSLTFSRHDLGYTAGMVKVPLTDIYNGTLGNYSDISMESFAQGAASRTINVNFAPENLLHLDGTDPAEIFISVPAGYYDGFFITMTDENDDVFIQTTTGSREINRGELIVLPDIRFEPVKDIAIEQAEYSASSADYELSAHPESFVRCLIVQKSAWDMYLTEDSGFDERSLGAELLNLYGSSQNADEYGRLAFNTSDALGDAFSMSPMTPGTEYIFLAAYTDAATVHGRLLTDIRFTAAPEGPSVSTEPFETGEEIPW